MDHGTAKPWRDVPSSLGPNETASKMRHTISPGRPNEVVGIGHRNNGTGKAAEAALCNEMALEVVFARSELTAHDALTWRNNGFLNTGTGVHPLSSDLPSGDAVTLPLRRCSCGIVFADRDNSTDQSLYPHVAVRYWVKGHRHPGRWIGSGRHRHWVRGYWVHGRWATSHLHRNEWTTSILHDLHDLGSAATHYLVDLAEGAVSDSNLGDISDQAVNLSGTDNSPWRAGVAADNLNGLNGSNQSCGLDPVANGSSAKEQFPLVFA